MPKHVARLEYLDDKQIRQLASLSNAHYPSTGISQTGTDDPQWYGANPATGETGGPWEYLTYLGTDGGSWKTRIHAERIPMSSQIKIWIESKTRDDEHENTNFEIVDWNGQKWKVTIDAAVGNNTAPGFTLSEI